MSASYARQQRRILKEVQARVDRVTESDAKFFERFPERKHRVRLAAAAELEQNTLVTGVADPRPSPGHRYYTVIRQIAPGVRIRLFAESFDDADVDMSEPEAKQVFDLTAAAHDAAAEVEQKLKEVLAKRGRA